ncbi:Alpha/Beta hydrolase fold containing protein [Parasponia andersonii]|uniref:Alpha/Beta hydrolase fold containing protein n=1 Tax=Parasponia andersonii TaxID=3476 RepID=A0A2P5BYZ5_PARAD|nr:Alpha/Beta hydrolase fold containing protein [Parasponia andersonii]
MEAWCWYKLIPLLKSLGHRVTALDKSGCGADPKQVEQITSYSDYIEPLMKFMESLHMAKEALLRQEIFGTVRRVLVLSEKDGCLGQEFKSWIIESGKMKELELILGADRMVMLSKPQELCICLQKIVEKLS